MGKSIKAQRAEWLRVKGITKREFAESTGQDFGTVYRWFDSERTPRRMYLDAILAVHPDWPHKA